MIQTIGATIGVIIGTLTLVGLAVRFVLAPYLRENVFKPLQRTEHALTANGHRDPEKPTMRDGFSDVLAEVRELRADVRKVHTRFDGLEERIEKREQWSDIETGRLWSAIKSR